VGAQVGGTFLRWGQTVCLTPDDLLVTVERMEQCTDGEGGPTGGCILRQLAVEYVDDNESIWPVAAYSNTLYYDGALLSQTPYAGLEPDQSVTRCVAPLTCCCCTHKAAERGCRTLLSVRAAMHG